MAKKHKTKKLQEAPLCGREEFQEFRLGEMVGQITKPQLRSRLRGNQSAVSATAARRSKGTSKTPTGKGFMQQAEAKTEAKRKVGEQAQEEGWRTEETCN